MSAVPASIQHLSRLAARPSAGKPSTADRFVPNARTRTWNTNEKRDVTTGRHGHGSMFLVAEEGMRNRCKSVRGGRCDDGEDEFVTVL
jgi:hypothetical protein